MVPIGWIFTLFSFSLFFRAFFCLSRALLVERKKFRKFGICSPPAPPFLREKREKEDGGEKKITKATGLFSRSPSLSRSFLPNFLHI